MEWTLNAGGSSVCDFIVSQPTDVTTTLQMLVLYANIRFVKLTLPSAVPTLSYYVLFTTQPQNSLWNQMIWLPWTWAAVKAASCNRRIRAIRYDFHPGIMTLICRCCVSSTWCLLKFMYFKLGGGYCTLIWTSQATLTLRLLLPP